MSRSLRLPIFLASLAQVFGCGELPPEAEGPPPGINEVAHSLSSISCTETSATGYKSGKPFSIKLVTVDGKNQEQGHGCGQGRRGGAAAPDGQPGGHALEHLQ